MDLCLSTAVTKQNPDERPTHTELFLDMPSSNPVKGATRMIRAHTHTHTPTNPSAFFFISAIGVVIVKAVSLIFSR